MRTSDLRGTFSGAEKYQKGMLKQSENIVHRLFNRQISRPRPNTHIHQARTLYENIVPSHTIYDVECPDQTFRKFTNDGQYLISFSRNHQDLVVYRHKWLNFCVKGEASDQPSDLPTKAKKFDSYFSHLYTIPLASGAEAICKDFFLSTENGLYGIFATSTIPENSNPASDGAVPGVPSTEKITIFVVSLAEGQITDQRSFQDDFIHLAHNMGVFLYDDLLAILSIRFQCIRILQIRETGRFVDVRTIGTHCREDDELVLNSQAQEEVLYHKQQASLRKARGLSQHDVSVSASKIAEQGKPWPPLWNVKPQQGQSSSRRERTRRQAHPSAHGLHNNFSNNAGASVHNLVPHENGNHRDSSVDPHANGNGNEAEIHEADLDLQYENYFRGLLETLEVSAVNEIGNHTANDGARPTAPIQGGMSASSRQASSVRILQEAPTSNGHNHSATGIENPQQNGFGSSPQLSSERTGATLQQPPLRNLELRTAYAPLDSVYPDRRNGSGSTSGASGGGGGGGNFTAGGPSRYGRSSYTSTTSGSSVDRYTSGRGSSSLRHTSTTITSSDSESQSRSDGSHRRDGRSFSGGSMSYGNGRAAGNGSVSVQSENGSFVEYVVSSRTRATGTVATTTQLIVPEEPAPVPRSSSLQGGSERRGFRLRENGGIFPSDGGPGSANGDLHSQEANPGDPNLDDRTLPSRPVGRSTTSGNNNTRAGDMNEIGNARPAQGHNNNGNGNRARPPRDGDNGNAAGAGTLHRNRPIADAAAGSNGGGAQVLGGIKQRLLSFIFQGVVNEDISPITKAQRLKRFYYHFQHYVDLVMWKVQFLDRYHLLIKFGSVDGVLQRNSDTSHQTAFLAIFNLETTEMLGFYQNSSEEFLSSFEHFCDHFRVAPRYPLYMSFISSYSNNSHVRDQLRKQRMACSSSKTGNFAQVVKRTLAWVPFNSQCQSPSAYFDQSLFHYDEKLISAIDRHKPCMEHPIKFISRRRPNCLKFKLSPGPEHGANDGRTKRVASFIFHPTFPFAISIQQSYMQPSIINFHFRK